MVTAGCLLGMYVILIFIEKEQNDELDDLTKSKITTGMELYTAASYT